MKGGNKSVTSGGGRRSYRLAGEQHSKSWSRKEVEGRGSWGSSLSRERIWTMLTFLSCSKRLGGADEVDSARGDPGLKETGKSLTSQVLDSLSLSLSEFAPLRSVSITPNFPNSHSLMLSRSCSVSLSSTSFLSHALSGPPSLPLLSFCLLPLGFVFLSLSLYLYLPPSLLPPYHRHLCNRSSEWL